MKYKSFTSASEVAHKRFVCRQLFLDFRDYGIDFLIGTTGIEMKCKKRYRKTVTFVCSANQVTAWEEKHGPENLLWMFMLYDLTCKVSSVRSATAIEKHVVNREFYILPWSFIYKHKIHDYPSWGPHYHFTTKDFPSDLRTETIDGTRYNFARDPKAEELFERRLFLLP